MWKTRISSCGEPLTEISPLTDFKLCSAVYVVFKENDLELFLLSGFVKGRSDPFVNFQEK